MKRSLLASTALCAVLAQGAFAADLPTMKGPPPAPVSPPVFNWTGFYVGGNVGALWSRDGVVDLDPNGNGYGAIPGNANTLSPDGIVGGVQAGYNYQISSFVLGVEADLDASSAKGSFGYPGYFSGVATHSASLPFFGDLRARAGVAFDRFLPYVTGGVVFADVKNSLVDPSTYDPSPLSVNRGGSATGWTIGGGGEYAIDSHWSVKAEYLFMQFPDVTKSGLFDNLGYAFSTFSFKFKDSAQLARVGLNYRF
jgi:outer membrane immunogenic protein